MDDNMRKGVRVAVTGATGMLGSHIVAELVRSGYADITLVVHNADRMNGVYDTMRRLGVSVPSAGFRIVETGLDGDYSEGLPAADLVFNCAARIMSGDMTREELVAHNVTVAQNVARWCLERGVGKLVHISSISALGEPEFGDTVDERCEAHDVSHYAAYGQSKYYSEREIWSAADKGLHVVVLAPGVILGEGTGGNNSSALVPAMSSGIPFYTDGLMSYVDVRDVARAAVLLARCPEADGRKFILSAGDLSYRELFTMGAHAAGRPVPFVRVGRGAVNAAYGLMRTGIALRLIKDRGVGRDNLGSVLRRTRYDGSAVTRICGFSYTPLEETVDRVVKYYRCGRKSRKNR